MGAVYVLVITMGIACLLLSGILFKKKHPFWILALVILNAGLFCLYFGYFRMHFNNIGSFFYPYNSLLIAIGIFVFFKNLQTRQISKTDKLLLGITFIEPILISFLFVLRYLDPNFTYSFWEPINNIVHFLFPISNIGMRSLVMNLQMLFFYLFAISFVVVLFKLFGILKIAEAQHRSFFCTDSFSYYKWIQRFFIFYTVIGTYAVVLVVSVQLRFIPNSYGVTSTLYITMGILGLGLFALGIFTPLRYAKEKDFKQFIDHIEQSKNLEIVEPPKENKSTPIYKGSQIADYKKDLITLLEKEKCYQDAQLSLASLAKLMNTSTRTASRVISEGFDKNFFDLINYYRTEEVKRNLLNEDYAHYSILSIGLEAGFNSKSTFYSTFKKNTGMTPSQYKKQNI